MQSGKPENAYTHAEVRTLIAALTSTDYRTRSRAADSLGKIGTSAKEAAFPLIEAMRDADWHVRARAASALGQVAPDIAAVAKELAKRLDDINPRVRAAAASSLGMMGQNAVEFIPLLLGKMGDIDLKVRTVAVNALAGLVPIADDVLKMLIKTLSDPDVNVRGYAASVIAKLGPQAQDTVPALIRSLNDTNTNVRRQACIALGKIGPAARKGVLALLKALDDKEPVVARDAEAAIRGICIEPDNIADALRPGFNSPDERVRLRALQFIGSPGFGSDTAVPLVQGLLKDRDIEVRRRAVDTLAAMCLDIKGIHVKGRDVKGIIPALMHALLVDDPYVRAASARALTNCGDARKRVVPALADALSKETYENVCRAIADALTTIGDPPVKSLISILTGASLSNAPLTDAPLPARRAAAYVLKTMGAASVPHLIELLNNSDDDKVKLTVLEMLCLLGPDASDALPALQAILESEGSMVIKKAAEVARGKVGG